MGLNTFNPAKSLSLSVTSVQSFASAIAAIIISSALRGRPLRVPSAISLAHTSAARSSKGSTLPANRACGPSGPENHLHRNSRKTGRPAPLPSAEFLSLMAAREGAPLCALQFPTLLPTGQFKQPALDLGQRERSDEQRVIGLIC